MKWKKIIYQPLVSVIFMKKVLKLERYEWESSALISYSSCVGHGTLWNQERKTAFFTVSNHWGRMRGRSRKNKVIFLLYMYQQEVQFTFVIFWLTSYRIWLFNEDDLICSCLLWVLVFCLGLLLVWCIYMKTQWEEITQDYPFKNDFPWFLCTQPSLIYRIFLNIKKYFLSVYIFKMK